MQDPACLVPEHRTPVPQPPTEGSGCHCAPIDGGKASFPAPQRLPGACCSGKLTPSGDKAFQLALQKSTAGPYPPASLPCHALLGPVARHAVWPFLLSLDSHCRPLLNAFADHQYQSQPPSCVVTVTTSNCQHVTKVCPPPNPSSQPAFHKPTPHSWQRLGDSLLVLHPTGVRLPA